MYLLYLLAFILSALPFYAYGFCVYNKQSDDTSLEARQYSFKNGLLTGFFRKRIPPDGKECCPYTNSDCNPNVEDANAVIKLYISRFNKKKDTGHFSVTLPADGWVEVEGDKVSHTIVARWSDGRNYNETVIEYGARWAPTTDELSTEPKIFK
ncbi:hypothetical protein BJV82DRAFT_583900 [Fennellomyces sp. T-0311]|nr:hypothetical protein BJV82DRAFT_583900 [Fennellomyces sp. T-0311]